ncbi:outer membrane lipoprotein chaperone LolA [Saccharospirillum impatiens]|uniref:outer membrane lipoprotein chaperone LolA n=1 Tax=Saccharospirillum impatiens TaxID=169438 RepID=UPI00040A00E1|nr:outer membrane lipoprotein chaperone LolA [Saccharospirillum impatiens]
MLNVFARSGVALLLSWVALAPQVNADEAARQRLIDLLESTETLQATFRQETYADGELRGDQAEGIMKIARPLKFVWEVSAPYEQSVISDGETLWVHDPDLLQATYQPVTSQLQESPAMILSQPESTLRTSYDVTEAANDSLTAYRLYPTSEDAVFEDMTLLFEDGRISELRLRDNLGQDTRITFSNVETNLTFDPADFEFTPPEGTDVFEQM